LGVRFRMRGLGGQGGRERERERERRGCEGPKKGEGQRKKVRF
jgi:hypothetical protein